MRVPRRSCCPALLLVTARKRERARAGCSSRLLCARARDASRTPGRRSGCRSGAVVDDDASDRAAAVAPERRPRLPCPRLDRTQSTLSPSLPRWFFFSTPNPHHTTLTTTYRHRAALECLSPAMPCRAVPYLRHGLQAAWPRMASHRRRFWPLAPCLLPSTPSPFVVPTIERANKGISVDKETTAASFDC
jgi:hypothetical protein